MFSDVKLSPPNELGYQFGVDRSLTEYAHNEQYNVGNVLPSLDFSILQVWKDNKHVANLIIDEKTNTAVKECYGFEATACAIDMYKLVKKNEEEKK